MQKLEITPPEFCPISGDWDELDEAEMSNKKLLNTA